MFNLIVDWNFDFQKKIHLLDKSRLFEYTNSEIKLSFSQDFARLSHLPCLFLNEGVDGKIARIGLINNIFESGKDIHFECSYYDKTLTNEFLHSKKEYLDIHDFEFNRTHWAVKNVDLYEFLYLNQENNFISPTAFKLDKSEKIEPDLISLMMPFSTEFDPIANSIKDLARELILRCERADDIWLHSTVIDDIISLINRSKIVICDCSQKNPNVFYEAGIAHTLGKEVILIAQHENDIPFDLKHFRYIKYLANAEGLESLKNNLRERIQTLLFH